MPKIGFVQKNSLKYVLPFKILGLCEGYETVVKHKTEFKYQKKSDLLAKDKDLAKFFLTSADKTASYRLPTSAADGKYTGCSKCLRSKEISYDGTFNAGKPTFSNGGMGGTEGSDGTEGPEGPEETDYMD